MFLEVRWPLRPSFLKRNLPRQSYLGVVMPHCIPPDKQVLCRGRADILPAQRAQFLILLHSHCSLSPGNGKRISVSVLILCHLGGYVAQGVRFHSTNLIWIMV